MIGLRFAVASFLLMGSVAGVHAQSAAPAAAMPAVPTTKVIAIGRVLHPLTAEERGSIMPKEVPATVRLYLDGKIDQWYFRQDGKGVVFIMNVTTVEEAHRLLEALPLGQAKLMEFDFIPVGPLSPLRLLLNDPSAAAQK